LGFLFAVPNFTGGFMGLWNEEMKHETTVIALASKLTSVALECCMTSIFQKEYHRQKKRPSQQGGV
jgi:hypothetical protein